MEYYIYTGKIPPMNAYFMKKSDDPNNRIMYHIRGVYDDTMDFRLMDIGDINGIPPYVLKKNGKTHYTSDEVHKIIDYIKHRHNIKIIDYDKHIEKGLKQIAPKRPVNVQ